MTEPILRTPLTATFAAQSGPISNTHVPDAALGADPGELVEVVPGKSGDRLPPIVDSPRDTATNADTTSATPDSITTNIQACAATVPPHSGQQCPASPSAPCANSGECPAIESAAVADGVVPTRDTATSAATGTVATAQTEDVATTTAKSLTGGAMASAPGKGEIVSTGALATARMAFRWLVTGPNPISLDGRGLAGLPARLIPLDELSKLLLKPGCPQVTRDAVWARLVERSRAEGGTWTVACVGMALPALIKVAARIADRFAGDSTDLDAAVLTGFLAHLAEVDLDRPGIMNRLRWAAYRAGLKAVREALDAPIPKAPDSCSLPPPSPSGHPDLILAQAVADGALTPQEAALIGSTRLETLTLRQAAQQTGMSYQALKRARARAEQRLLAYLRQHQGIAISITTARPARKTGSTTDDPTTTTTTAEPGRASSIRRNQRGTLSPNAPRSGVQGCRTPLPTGTPASGSEVRPCA